MNENNFNDQNNQNNQQFQDVNNGMINTQPEMQYQPMAEQNQYVNPVQPVAEQPQYANPEQPMVNQNQFVSQSQIMSTESNPTMPQQNNQKKVNKGILVIVLLVVVVGIGLIVYLNSSKNNNKGNDTSTTTTTTKIINQNSATKNNFNWNEHKVVINGKEIQLPMLYSEFVSITGYEGDETELNRDLTSDYYILTYIENPDDEFSALFAIKIENLTENEKKASECYVTAITQDRNDKIDKIEVIFAKDLKVGNKITENELLDLFGQPDMIWDFENYKEYVYTENPPLSASFVIDISEYNVIEFMILS